MDPNVTYDMMIHAECDGDWDDVRAYAENLHAWVAHGGFEPNRPNWRAHLANALQRADAHAKRHTIANANGMGMH